MKTSKRTKIPSEALTEAEVEAILSAAQGPTVDPRLHAIILLGLNHGLRVSELCKLRPEHLQVTLHGAVEPTAPADTLRRTGHLILIRGKGSASGRHDLTSEECKLLEPYIAYPAPDGTLFGLRRVRMYGLIRELCSSIGLPQSKQSPHCLRHTCVKRALARGASLPEVQKFVGHKSLASTGHYTKVSESEASNACLGTGRTEVERTVSRDFMRAMHGITYGMSLERAGEKFREEWERRVRELRGAKEDEWTKGTWVDDRQIIMGPDRNLRCLCHPGAATAHAMTQMDPWTWLCEFCGQEFLAEEPNFG